MNQRDRRPITEKTVLAAGVWIHDITGQPYVIAARSFAALLHIAKANNIVLPERKYCRKLQLKFIKARGYNQ